MLTYFMSYLNKIYKKIVHFQNLIFFFLLKYKSKINKINKFFKILININALNFNVSFT